MENAISGIGSSSVCWGRYCKSSKEYLVFKQRVQQLGHTGMKEQVRRELRVVE